MAEIIFDDRDPNYNGWLQKDQDVVTSENNWRRLGDIVAHDLFQVSGLRNELNRRQRNRLDRQLELALDPEVPLTRKETRRANRSHEPGFPLWFIPLILPLTAVVKTLEAAEKYAEKGKPGASLILRQRDSMQHSLAMDQTLRETTGNILHSSLQPEIRAGYRALKLDTEPRDYVINTKNLLDVVGDASLQDGTDDTVNKLGLLQIFANASPQLQSIKDQRAHAAGIFMGSTLLRDGELSSIRIGQRADFSADGPDTFRIHVTSPYQYLYDQSPYLRESGGDKPYPDSPDVLAKTILDPNPIDELLAQSRA